MGMFDEIRWDAALPEGHLDDDRLFQTKSLDPCLEHYVVNRQGRLLLVGNGLGDDTEWGEIPPGIDVEFHGDIHLLSIKGHRQYLARFTHGTLEWIRPLADGEPWDRVALTQMKWVQLHSKTNEPLKPQIGHVRGSSWRRVKSLLALH